jgi:hypothetical protein
VRTYIDGDNGDSDANEPLLDNLRNAMRGVDRVAVRGSNSAMNAALADRLGKEAALSVSDSAPVVIDWDATLEQVGRGSKRRSATATVSKNGRVIFKYELPSEIFRVGDTPAEAFARVFAQALDQ